MINTMHRMLELKETHHGPFMIIFLLIMRKTRFNEIMIWLQVISSKLQPGPQPLCCLSPSLFHCCGLLFSLPLISHLDQLCNLLVPLLLCGIMEINITYVAEVEDEKEAKHALSMACQILSSFVFSLF